MREYRAKYRAANKEKVRDTNAAWKANNRDKVVGYHVMEKYKLTLEQYNTMYEAANGLCQICFSQVLHMSAPGGRAEKACVDHCHKTGKVRGILCHTCNIRLAFVEEHGASALSYLKRNT